jgi:ubiquitin-conjugating enzyme E2 S
LLIYPFPESSLNDEAGKLFMESYDEYSKRARLMADVHGRPTSSVMVNNGGSDVGESDKRRKPSDTSNGDGSNNDGDDDGDDSPQRRKTRVVGESTSGANPLASKNSNSNAVGTKSGKSLGSKQPSGRMNKKKSLKRL